VIDRYASGARIGRISRMLRPSSVSAFSRLLFYHHSSLPVIVQKVTLILFGRPTTKSQHVCVQNRIIEARVGYFEGT